MKTSIHLMLAGALAVSSLFAPVHAASSDAAFKALYEQEWRWRVDNDLASDDAAPRISNPAFAHEDSATQQRHLVYWQGILKAVDAIDPATLSPSARVDYAIYRAQIAAFADALRFREYEMPVNADSAFWTDINYIARRPFTDIAGYENYIARLNALPVYFDENLANMRAGLARGFTPPKVTLLGRDMALVAVATAARPDDTVFFAPFKDMPATIPAAQQDALRARGRAAIVQHVQPAYVKALAFMRSDYMPHARTTVAATSLPDGAAYYQSKITEFTTTALTPEQIHQIGLSEMAKIRAEMDATIRQTGFTGSFPAFLTFLRTDPQFYAKTAEELLMRAAWTAKKFDGKASRYFGYLPRQRFAILPVPDDQAPFYTAARGGPGVYLVNTYNLPARPLYSLPALTLHESAPGHAFQLPVAAEQNNVPNFRKAYIFAYGEGWALYCERLGVEMGMYATPYETFGMLSYQAWRAARLVVDTGVHAKGWTRDQALAYLRDNTALSEHEITTEVDRYISWPGQALSYYLGEMTIVAARRKAEAALGPQFDIRAFHDTVLQLGSVPLPVLTARIDTFIADGGKNPYGDEPAR
ncbi:MAG: DUF885 family protein [Pseudomonadota bacterium]|nr:DUF885 family protein [Pseudomonadota bacterium]